MFEKKHICLIDYDMSDWGGVEQVIENLSQAFRADYQVSIVSLCSGFLKDYEGIACHTIIGKRARMREILLRGYVKLIQVLNRNQVDIVIVCESCAGMIVTLARPFIRAKVIFADHSVLISAWEDKPIRYMRYLNSRVTDYTVTLTEKNREDYIRYFHFPPNKICNIYNWIGEKVFEAVQEYQSGVKKILTVGRLEQVKGFDRLLDIAKDILPKYPNWEWHIYGDGSQRKMLEEGIVEYGLEGQLILEGASNNVFEEYHKYSIYVLTSYSEGLPLALLEAKANRLPLVSFDILTGPSEIIEDGENGYLVKDGDIPGIVGKLEILMQDERLRSSFSAKAYRGIEKFQKDIILSQWQELFHKMLS